MEAETVPGMPDEPTVDDVCRLAPFRVLASGPSAELLRYTHMAGRLTAVTLACGAIEVTTEVSPQILYSLPADVVPRPERRARDRLAQERVHDELAARRGSRSEPARTLDRAAARRQATAQADAAQAQEATIEVDGAPVPFTLVEQEGWWAAVADVADTRVTIAARDVPASEVALQTISHP